MSLLSMMNILHQPAMPACTLVPAFNSPPTLLLASRHLLEVHHSSNSLLSCSSVCQTSGAGHFGSGLQQPSNGFAGFPPSSGSSPFLDFTAQQPSMADIFPGQASAQQPATSHATSSSLGHWSSASGAASGQRQFPDHGRSLQVSSR